MTRAAATITLSAALLGCQPDTTLHPPTCPSLPPGPGEVVIGEARCDAFQIVGGAAASADVGLATADLRLVLRAPTASLSLAGLGGGTLIDAAPWGSRDGLLEAAPLVQGGWLMSARATEVPGGLRLDGVIRSLPDAVAPGDGQPASVTWRPDPTGPWIHLDGADGLWLHTEGDATRVGDWLVVGDVVYGHDGVVAQDLGGALRIEGVTRMLVASTSEAWAHRPGPTQQVALTAPGAREVRAWRDGELVHIQRVEGGEATLTLPADATEVQVFAPEQAPSPRRAPAPQLHLSPGSKGSLVVRVAWSDEPRRPVRLRWRDNLHRVGEALLPPDGDTLDVGAGRYELELSAGPTFPSRQVHVEVLPGAKAPITVRLERTFDPGQLILASLSTPSARSRTRRSSDAQVARDAAGRGLQWAVFTAEDDAGTFDPGADAAPWILGLTGAKLTRRAGGSVLGWPWSGSARRAAGGVPATQDDVLQAVHDHAWSGPSSPRRTRVPLELLQQLGGVGWQLDPVPTQIELPAPGFPPFPRWQRWFDRLDEGVPLNPAGPLLWVAVPDPQRFGTPDVTRSLLRGRYATGTGALLVLAAEAGSNAVEGTRRLRVLAHPAGTAVSNLALLTTGGELLQQWALPIGGRTVTTEVELGSWVIAVAWSDDGAAWAVTAPLWLRDPGAPLPDTADEE